ncbi:uncharacterized protein Sptz [Venturia canescens]|uniref:uncharacterized protein Sptz n=1 Tax=Venturia canescens TaxID=32260 RepID=UPI001C9D454C|nr:uncharacterized protein LOC122408640 [Venturia canescens]
MSKQTNLMKLEKCIVSRLWYVATVLHEKESTDRCRHYRDVKKLINLIDSCFEQQLDEQKWIAYNLAFKLDKNEEAKKRLFHEEFVHTVKLLDTRIPPCTREELLRLFKAVTAAPENTEVPTCILSQESLQCLEKNMLEYPALIHWIVNALLCIWLPTKFAPTDSSLQQVYLSSMKQLLETFPQRAHEVNVKNTISFLTNNLINEVENKNLGILLSILSKLEMTDAKENEMLEWLFPALLDKTNTDDIELAFYSRKNPNIFRAWHEFLDDIYVRCHEVRDLENSLKISRVMFKSKDNLSVAFNANEIFKRVLRRKTHWLNDILDVCYVPLMNEEYTEVERILSTPALGSFWLPLLLKLLKDCPNVLIFPIQEKSEKGTVVCDALRFVLKKLSKEARDDTTLQLLTSTLENHLKVLDWILENKASSTTGSKISLPNTVFPNFSVKYALNLLQSHSILSVLKMTTNIHEKSSKDICSLLSETDSKNTFQAYHTMLSALKGILSCEYYNEKYNEVAKHLDEMEKSLGRLFPLDLRLQVIENIFSMIFLRYEHFIEVDSASDIGEEDFTLRGKENSMTIKNSAESEIGFVCNKYATREILIRLRRSLNGLVLESADQKKDGTLSMETRDYLEKNTSLLSKALVDASWRLELLTSVDFVKRQGTPDVDSQKTKVFNTPTFGDGMIGFSTNSKNKYSFYEPNESSSDESELMKSDIEGSSENGSQGNTTNSKRRKRSKNLSSPMSKGSTNASKESKNPERTLNSMLASNESLVLQCLWRCDYDRALQVIEMFQMKNTPLDGEILFSRAMRMFRKDMRAQWNNSNGVDSTDGVSEQSTLENIRRAVQGGFQTSRTTSQIETFLASQESSIRSLNADSMSAKELLTMASLDLALTMARTHQDSINLSDVTMKYLKCCKKLANTRYHVFFDSIYELLYEKDDLSMKEILCDARIPLSVKEAREKKEFWSRLRKKLDDFHRSLVEQYENNFDETGIENSTEICDENFQDVISMCDNGELYLFRVYAHLKLLRTIVPDNFETLGENSHLLEISLDTYIGDQIFRLNAELEEIEPIASQLRVNLVHSILVNCCPKLSCSSEISTRINDTWGFVVLNKCCGTDGSSNVSYEPNQCVKDILSELIEAIQEELPTGSSTLRRVEAIEMGEKEKIREILRKSERLAMLDLSNLSFGHHTLAFFINVWNLLMIHALLEIWSKDPPIDELRHEISLSSVGYNIGDLGTVSLGALRSKLIGQSQLWGTRYFSQTEELNEPAWQDLDVPHEPRVLFAMVNEHENSPIIRVYDLKTLDDDLRTSMMNYTSHHETRDTSMQRTKKKTAFASELLQFYDDLIAKRTNSLNDENNSSTERESVSTIDSKSPKCLPCLYHVSFSYTEEFTETEDDETRVMRQNDDEFPWQSRLVRPNLLQYLEGHCWLLSYLVQRIHEESPTILDSNCENLGRTAALENLLKSSWINDLKYLCDNNETVAGLRNTTASEAIWKIFETLLVNEEFYKCLEILQALPESLVTRNTEIQRLTDKILVKLITNPNDRNISETMSYVYRIKDVHVLVQMILENANDLPVKVCQESLKHILSHRNKDKLPIHCKSRMNEILCRVTVFYKMLPYCAKKNSEDGESWGNLVYHTEKTNPVRIVKSLIDANQYELCLEWLEYQAVSSEIHSLITQDLLIGLLNNDENDYKQSLKLLRALPTKKSVNLCLGVLGKLESIGALRFVVGYLQENVSSIEVSKYRRASLGIDILEQLDVKERRSYLHLIEQPLHMLEQLLMNCRLDCLQKIVLAAREKHHDKFNLYTEHFDEIVRFYAKKSLDFRVAVQTDATDKIKDASISSNKSQNGDFVMPINIPTKEEWVPNDKASECSCCRVVIFSMFNRRHHCRRCGRVVCGACSPQRMRLPSYSTSVPVRVCNDCKRQSLVQMQTAPSTPSSETFDCWRLTVDETHNTTLREEFSFENAPNISLCLAILNLHSDHEAYSNFLLDRCDEMKSLLRPDSKGRINPEVDHALIIKMIKSLLVAAKVKCAELGLNTGFTHCDRFLSQVDLIMTLVNSDCSYLIPRTDADDHLDEHTLRRLRDMLTEKEQWTIALDVSTKTGLDTHGVWAAWGTACLKVGNYERARDKFVHCLDKVSREDSDDWVMLSYPSDSYGERNKRLSESWNSGEDFRRRNASFKSQEGLKNRPSKDPPLLTEILQILERINPNDAYAHAKPKCNGAQEILNTLNSLKAVSQGQYTIGHTNLAPKNVRYQESLYYLLMYGSFNSILGFFIKHSEYEKCLAYILENEVEPELFMNCVFLSCVKNGCMMNLCESMRSKDPSLGVFKKYLLYTCHSLERKQLLHTLHQLQLFMKDYVRAAMTCIRFYITDATSYEDLCSRTQLLVEAQKHLESELQIETFGKKRRKSVTSSHSGQNNLTLEMDPIEIDRHINTISRQMEIAKFLSNREQEGKSVSEFMNKLSYMDSESSNTRTVPTLFGNQQEKSYLAVLAILCGRDVEEGFGIAFRIMQDYNLRPQKIYSQVGHMLALDRKVSSIEQLIKCCRSSGAPNSSAISDRVLAHCVKLLLDRSRTDSDPSPKDQIDSLIRIITDVELKIESYIESRQLKAAYLLAVKHSRAQDIKKILKEADRLGQIAIKSICTKWLQQTQKSRDDLL